MNSWSGSSLKHSAWLVASSACLVLAACSNPSNNSAQNPPPATAAPAANAPAAAGTQAPASTSSMSVAELTAPANAPGAPSNPAAAPTTPTPAAPDNVEYAQVISVTALTGPQRICSDQTIVEKRPQADNHQVAGTVIGAIAGGVIGSKLGGGGGRKITTIAGAVGGGIAGKKIQEAQQNNDTVTRVVQRCHDVVPGRDVPQLFDVVYTYQGQNLHAKIDFDPGNRIALPVHSVQ